jgi:hypothetical protein
MLSSLKIKNMYAMSPKQLHDFIHVIYNMRKHHTKVEYFFPLHILFIAIYLPLD